MIEKGNFITEIGEFDRRISPSDWRFSASIVGMVRYFKLMNLKYDIDFQHLYYNYSDVGVEGNNKYFTYVEKRYEDKMHHVQVERLLLNNTLSVEEEKIFKDKISGNAIMKNIFPKLTFEDKDTIASLLDENRSTLISGTFCTAKTGYAKYANSNKFRSTGDTVCRLLGYYVDTGRKTKSLSFGFDDSTRNYSDEIEFDFIPFAFTDDREAIFVNNNFSVDQLVKTNDLVKDAIKLMDGRDFRSKLFYSVSEGGSYFDYDVEIVIKEQDVDFFKTLFVRRESIEIFNKLTKLDSFSNLQKALSSNIKVTDDYYIRVMSEVTNSILNLTVLDGLINYALKNDRGFLVSQLIKVNRLIYEKKYQKEGKMTYYGGYNSVKDSASSVKAYLTRKFGNNASNKINSYRHKLISSLVANDKDRFVEVMLQLSSYTETQFTFLHDIIVHWDMNKNLAYDFVNQLNYFENNKKVEGAENNEK